MLKGRLWVLEPVLFRILGTSVLSSKPACVSTSFELNHCNQRHVISRGCCTKQSDLYSFTLQVKGNLPFSCYSRKPTFCFRTNLFLVEKLRTSKSDLGTGTEQVTHWWKGLLVSNTSINYTYHDSEETLFYINVLNHHELIQECVEQINEYTSLNECGATLQV